jgi:hypothetical protein
MRAKAEEKRKAEAEANKKAGEAFLAAKQVQARCHRAPQRPSVQGHQAG